MDWGSGRQKLKDTEERQPKLSRTSKVAFFAPHTSEHPAVLPLISTISGKLGHQGIICETHSIDDMPARVRSLSVELAKFQFTKPERRKLQALFRLKDADIRLSVLCGILRQNPAAIVLEMHALDKDYHYKDQFDWAGHFFRLPGTRVLYLKDLKSEYSVPVGAGLRVLGDHCEEKLRAAARVLELDPKAIKESVASLLGELESARRRTLLIEIPAPAMEEWPNLSTHTRFERSYGAMMSGMHTLGQRDVEVLLSLF